MSNRATAWTLFAIGLALLVFVGFFVMFLFAQASSGCDLKYLQHPAFCDLELTRRLVVLEPVIAVAIYVVGSVVGIILLKASRWAILVPGVLAVLVIGSWVLLAFTVS